MVGNVDQAELLEEVNVHGLVVIGVAQPSVRYDFQPHLQARCHDGLRRFRFRALIKVA